MTKDELIPNIEFMMRHLAIYQPDFKPSSYSSETNLLAYPFNDDETIKINSKEELDRLFTKIIVPMDKTLEPIFVRSDSQQKYVYYDSEKYHRWLFIRICIGSIMNFIPELIRYREFDLAYKAMDKVMYFQAKTFGHGEKLTILDVIWEGIYDKGKGVEQGANYEATLKSIIDCILYRVEFFTEDDSLRLFKALDEWHTVAAIYSPYDLTPIYKNKGAFDIWDKTLDRKQYDSDVMYSLYHELAVDAWFALLP